MSVNDAGRTETAVLSPSSGATPKWLAGAGLVAGLGAVVASSCCVLPLGLAALGAGAGVFGVLNEVAAWRVTFLALSALAVSGGWGAWWMKRREACATGPCCATPARNPSTALLLILATAILIAAASWDHIDPLLLKLFREH